MKTLRLLPTVWKPVGFVLALAGAVLGALTVFGNFEIPGFGFNLRKEDEFLVSRFENFTQELALTLLLVGLLMMAFSRVRHEDERVQLIRLEAFQWSFLFQFGILLAANWLLYGGNFFYAMLFNLFTPLIVFLLRFHYVLYLSNQESADETIETT
ncbi:MAG TPA: hypothetical protein PKL15_12370 [Saprospiraceae bacterium]|nr:hypothetical protein [Saprospiraceae bacterium]HNM26223.1 hypothetical protein [Saprospiraceae bacterium]